MRSVCLEPKVAFDNQRIPAICGCQAAADGIRRPTRAVVVREGHQRACARQLRDERAPGAVVGEQDRIEGRRRGQRVTDVGPCGRTPGRTGGLEANRNGKKHLALRFGLVPAAPGAIESFYVRQFER